ncbi:MAG: hypothetical protein GWN71_41860, partial [Gammaproteobacteria bacterium]|nr:hypothetical protein [Gemmatimonadota bacterium]NIU79856.1 hypothetical protein [Gammaproteobacteria bacterium]
QQDLEFLPHAVDSSSSDQEGAPGLTNDGCVAVFKIDPTYLTGPRNIAGNVVYVTL